MTTMHYIYVLFRPWNGVPCYVGKGTRRRWQAHFVAGEDHYNRILGSVFARANKLGLEVPCIIIRTGLTNEQANETEIALIKAIGRRDLETGPLANMSNGGDGGDFGAAISRTKADWTPEQRTAICQTYREVTKEWWASLTLEERASHSAKFTETGLSSMKTLRETDPEFERNRAEQIKLGHAKRTPEQKEEANLKALISFPSEKRSEVASAHWATLSPAERSLRQKGKSTLEERRERGKQAAAKVPREQRSNQVKRQQENLTPEQCERRRQRALKLSVGTKWITNGSQRKRVPENDPLPEGWRYGKKLTQ